MPRPKPIPATRRIPVGYGAMSARFAPDGQILSAGQFGVKLGDRVLRGEGPLCWEAAVSPDGRHVLAAFRDNVTLLWDARSGAVVATLEADREPPVTAALADGRALTGHPQLKCLTLWEVPSGKKIRTLKLKKSSALHLDLSRDGLRGACGDADKTVYVWDLESGALLHELKGHTGRILSVQFSHDGQRLASASADKTARVWDLTTGAELACLDGHKKLVAAAVFRADGAIATNGGEGVLRLWSGGAVVAELESGSFDARNIVFRFGYSLDGDQLVVPGYDDVAVWEGLHALQPAP